MIKNKLKPKLLLLGLTSMLLLSSCGSTISTDPPSQKITKLDMSLNNCYIGYNAADITPLAYSTTTGCKPALGGLFISLVYNKTPIRPDSTDDTGTPYITRIRTIVLQHAVPVITWEPWDSYSSYQSQNILQDIINGDYDNEITLWATALKDLNYPIIIRFGHEMNGNWYPWANDATLYKQAFQYMVTKFRENKAFQVQWMFAPNHNDGGSGRNYKDYFPGTANIDCLGVSGYNFGAITVGSNQFTWRSFDDIYQSIITDLNQTYNLPIFLDIGCGETGGSKAFWIENMLSQLKNNPTYSSIKGFLWFEYNKETDWRVESSAASLTSYQTYINNSYFVSSPNFTTVEQ